MVISRSSYQPLTKLWFLVLKYVEISSTYSRMGLDPQNIFEIYELKITTLSSVTYKIAIEAIFLVIFEC